MQRFNVETGVGIFMVLGFACFAWLAIKLGNVDLFGDQHYQVEARFGSISGLKEGATVEMAGVRIGTVEAIRLDPTSYQAIVELSLAQGLKLQEDSIASIRTAGIIGDRYVSISPGGSDVLIPPGGKILETESAINLEELVSKYIFEKK